MDEPTTIHPQQAASPPPHPGPDPHHDFFSVVNKLTEMNQRMATNESDVKSLAGTIKELSTNIHSTIKEFADRTEKRFGSIEDKIAKKSETPWVTLFGALTLLGSALIWFSNSQTGPLDRAETATAQAVGELAKVVAANDRANLTQLYEMQKEVSSKYVSRPDIDAALQAVRDAAKTRSDFDEKLREEWQRTIEARQQSTADAVKALRGDVVTRAEHQREWDTFDHQIAALNDRLRFLETEKMRGK